MIRATGTAGGESVGARLDRRISRRRFLGYLGAAAAVPVLARCSGGGRPPTTPTLSPGTARSLFGAFINERVEHGDFADWNHRLGLILKADRFYFEMDDIRSGRFDVSEAVSTGARPVTPNLTANRRGTCRCPGPSSP